jgi:hypothetical protein
MKLYPSESWLNGGSGMSEKSRKFGCGCVVEWSENTIKFTACSKHTSLVEPAVELCMNRIDG